MSNKSDKEKQGGNSGKQGESMGETRGIRDTQGKQEETRGNRENNKK